MYGLQATRRNVLTGHSLATWIDPPSSRREGADRLSDLRELVLSPKVCRICKLADADGAVTFMLIDGRNRREACRRAKVQPMVWMLVEEDATAFVLSVNVNRRHMTAGQRAAARALLQPEGEQGKRSDLGTSFPRKEVDVSAPMLSKARLVLRHDRPLLLSVINGAVSLDEAYNRAKHLQSEQEAKEAAQAAERSKLDGLRKRFQISLVGQRKMHHD